MAGTLKPYTNLQEARYTLISGRTYGNYLKLFDGSISVNTYDDGYFGGSQHYVIFETSDPFYVWCITNTYPEHNGKLMIAKWNGTSYIDVNYICRNKDTNWYKNDFILQSGKYKIYNPTTAYRIDTEWFFEKAQIYKFLIRNDSQIKYWNGTSFSSIGYPITKEMFENSGHDNPDEIIEHIELLDGTTDILSYDPSNSQSKAIEMISVPKSSIIVSDSISFQDSENIDNLTISAVSVNNSKIRILLSPDKINYYYLDNNDWTQTNLTKENLILNGFTIDQFNQINTKMNSFPFGPIKKIYIAVYIEINNTTSDTLNIDKITFQIDLKGSWWDLKDNEFDYGLVNNNSLHIRLLFPGTYKINY